ncbi:hypothetical protein ABW19_dt0202956 [Dactylella cylindrospora]|nr:hypothetical protein ABW19_dt0202956 [Dactylella cylindrospora]
MNFQALSLFLFAIISIRGVPPVSSLPHPDVTAGEEYSSGTHNASNLHRIFPRVEGIELTADGKRKYPDLTLGQLAFYHLGPADSEGDPAWVQHLVPRIATQEVAPNSLFEIRGPSGREGMPSKRFKEYAIKGSALANAMEFSLIDSIKLKQSPSPALRITEENNYQWGGSLEEAEKAEKDKKEREFRSRVPRPPWTPSPPKQYTLRGLWAPHPSNRREFEDHREDYRLRVKGLKRPERPEYCTLSLRNVGERAKTPYRFYYSQKYRNLVSMKLREDQDQAIDKLPLSDVLYAAWEKVAASPVLPKFKVGRADEGDTIKYGKRFYIALGVDDPISKPILDEIFAMFDKDKSENPDPGLALMNPTRTDTYDLLSRYSFYALLATPALKHLIYMLVEHRSTSQPKGFALGHGEVVRLRIDPWEVPTKGKEVKLSYNIQVYIDDIRNGADGAELEDLFSLAGYVIAL